MTCVQCGKETFGRLCAACKGEIPTLEDIRGAIEKFDAPAMTFGEMLEAADPGGVNRRRNLAALDSMTKESIWYVVYAGTICPKVLSVESTARAAVQAIALSSSPTATVQAIKATTAAEAAERAQAFLNTMLQRSVDLVTQTMERTAAQQASDVAQLSELAETLGEPIEPKPLTPDVVARMMQQCGEPPRFRGNVIDQLMGQREWLKKELTKTKLEQIPGHCKDCGNWGDCLDDTKWCQVLDAWDTPPNGSGFCWKFKAKS